VSSAYWDSLDSAFLYLKIIIPTNGKQKDLIEENYYNKKKKILEIIKTWQKRDQWNQF
jgi:hypothetical protein